MEDKSYGFLLSVIAGAVTIFMTVLLALVGLKVFSSLFGQLIKSEVFSFLTWILILQVLCGVLMIAGGFLIKKGHHFLGGTVVLFMSIVGFFIGAGIFFGPVLGIIGAVIGFKEEFE